MNSTRNSFGRELPRAAAAILDGWLKNIELGHLPPEAVTADGNGKMTALAVSVDGEPMTVRAFLKACREAEPEKVDGILHALDRRSTVDATRPYSVPDLVTPVRDAALLNLLATRLRNGGPVPAKVSPIGERHRGPESLRDVLLDMQSDRGDRAKAAREALGLNDMPDGKVAGVILDRLERAGVLERVGQGDDRATVTSRLMEQERVRTGAAGR